jgi:prephenate dehydrogenase
MKRVTLIGLGLMGGSLGLALRRAGLAGHIVGCGRAELQRRAVEMSAIDSGCTDAAESVAGSDFVFLCTPVETSITLLERIAPHLSPAALVTDVGSTKSAFAAAARRIFGASANQRVLPGHPLAGREVSGLEYAVADLYADCIWVLTAVAGEASGATEDPIASHRTLHAALQAIGARVVFTTPEEHDRTLAYTSHLPQMLSTALSLTLEDAFGAGNPALQIHAGGLRSMLRLARSEPSMWEQIAASNRVNIAEALQRMEYELKALRESLGDAEFRTKFEQAREFAKFVKG